MPGLNQHIWGEVFWRLMNRVAYYSDVYQLDHNTLFIFFTTLILLLPCPVCQRKSVTYMHHQKKAFLRHCKNKSLLSWVFKFHNHVNAQLQKTTTIQLDLVYRRCLLYHLNPLKVDARPVFFTLFQYHRDNNSPTHKHCKLLLIKSYISIEQSLQGNRHPEEHIVDFRSTFKKYFFPFTRYSELHRQFMKIFHYKKIN